MRAIIALAWKDVRLLLRDKAGLFFAVGFPLLMAVFFGTIFGGAGSSDGPTGIPIVVVDADGTDESGAFIRDLSREDAFKVFEAETREDAVDLVRRGQRSAAVVLAEGFGAASETVFYGDPARVELITDPSRGAEAAMIEGLLTREAFERMQDRMSDTSFMRSNTSNALEEVRDDPEIDPDERENLTSFLSSLDTFLSQTEGGVFGGGAGGEGGGAWQPVEIDSKPVTELGGAGDESDEQASASDGPSAYAISFPQGIVWGLMGVAAGFGISLVVERTNGTLRRLRIAPISRTHVLAGKALACFVTTLAISVLLLLIAGLVFGVRPADPFLLSVGLVSAALCFVGIMMLLSVLGRTEQAAGGIGWAVLLILGMFGGAMVPLAVMPGWMQSAASVSPVKWAILAVEGPLWRGYSAGEMLLPCAVLIGVGAAAFALGAAIFARRQEV